MKEGIMSNNKNIFIATPIAGFLNKEDYKKYRRLIEAVIVELKNIKGLGNIYCEITNLDDVYNYDTPAVSAMKDFNNILNSEYFVLLYPQRVVSSALIELGYALAEGKKILIISSSKEALPYMALELDKIYSNVKIKCIEFTFQNIYDFIRTTCC